MSSVKNKIIVITLISILNSRECIQAMHNTMHAYQDSEADHEEVAAAPMPFFTLEQIKEASTKLIRSVENNNFKEAQEAIAEGADVNRYYMKRTSLLDVAVFEGQADIIDLLLDHNAEITGFAVIVCAAIKPNLFILNKLLARYENINVIDQVLHQSVTDELIGYLNESYASSDSRYIKRKKAMQMFALAGADLTIKVDTSIFSKIATIISNFSFSRLPRSIRSDAYQVIADQDECFKKLECILQLLSHMPRELIITSVDYAMPLYDIHDIDEDDQQVFDVLNRTVIEKWEQIKKPL